MKISFSAFLPSIISSAGFHGKYTQLWETPEQTGQQAALAEKEA